MIDARYTEAHRHNDGAGRGWAFDEAPVTSSGILRNIPAFIIILVVLAAVSVLWWI